MCGIHYCRVQKFNSYLAHNKVHEIKRCPWQWCQKLNLEQTKWDKFMYDAMKMYGNKCNEFDVVWWMMGIQFKFICSPML